MSELLTSTVAQASSHDIEEARRRLGQIFRFLLDLHRLRSPTKHTLQQRDWKLRLSSLPECAAVRWGVPDQDDFILSVRRTNEQACPPPPDQLREWLQPGWDDPAQAEPSPREGDFPHQAAWDHWSLQRSAWSENERKVRAANALFQQLFELKGRLDRESESIELMFGDGVLHWHTDQAPTAHPVLLQRVELEFLPTSAEFQVRESERPPELYTQLLRLCKGVDGRTLQNYLGLAETQNCSPWSREEADSYLRVLSQSLWGNGQFSPDPSHKPTNGAPTIVRDPYLYAGDRNQGFGRAIETYLDKLPSLTEFPTALLRIVGLEPPAPESEADLDLLFTKPANREQERVARRLSETGSVLVQGPPGTGKTHTIANLISHLLAQGKSILITSHTAKALRVVRDQVVEALRPLCVSVLDQQAQSQQQLEVAVQEIVAKLSSSDAGLLESQAHQLQERRVWLRSQIEQKEQDLLKARMSEFTPFDSGLGGLLPAEAARRVAAGKGVDDWLPGLVEPGPPPLTRGEFLELYELTGELAPEVEQYLADPLPPIASLPQEHEFASMVARIKHIESQGLTPDRVREWQERATSREALEQLAQLSDKSLSSLGQGRDWELLCIQAASQGGPHRQLWEELAAKIESAYTELAQFQSLILDHGPVLNDSAALEDHERISGEILEHLRSGGQLSRMTLLFKSAWKRFVDGARVDSGKPSRPEHFESLRARARTEMSLRALKLRWDRQMAAGGAPASTELGDSFLATAHQHVSKIRAALSWELECQRPWEAALAEARILWQPLQDCIDPDPSPQGGLRRWKRAVEEKLRPLIDEGLKHHELAGLNRQVGELVSLLNRHCEGCSQQALSHELLRAVNRRSEEEYTQVYARLIHVAGKAERMARRRELLSRLQKSAPQWSKQVRDRVPPHDQTLPPGDPFSAWNHAQWRQELEQRARIDLDALQRDLRESKDQLRKITSEYVECRTWAAQIRRTGLKQQQSLVGWLDLVRRIGKGTGKRAPRLRAQARQTLAECRDAVPVWIMPLSQVAENYLPGTCQFDVVILDEASQCDAMGLVALSLAREVLVVGDHEQVSPEAVGQDLDPVEKLIDQHLAEIPNKELYDGRTSVYDMARQSFGGTIRLREHFRCVPDIIEFSNQLCYSGEILPLRECDSILLRTACDHVEGAGTVRKVNELEALRVTALVKAVCEHPALAGQSVGVISMVGEEQALRIDRQLAHHLSLEEYERRRIVCGNSAQFQGDERDIVFLSMVDSPGAAALPMRNTEPFRKRFNVAASRARNLMWVVHSLQPERDLKPGDLRLRLIRHAQSPEIPTEEQEQPLSEFQTVVRGALERAGYRVEPHWKVGRYSIGLAVFGTNSRLAVECEGGRFLTEDQLRQLAASQQVLERVGDWRFLRVRSSRFFLDPERCIQDILESLRRLGVEPGATQRNRSAADADRLREDIRARALALLAEWTASAAPTPVPATEERTCTPDLDLFPSRWQSAVLRLAKRPGLFIEAGSDVMGPGGRVVGAYEAELAFRDRVFFLLDRESVGAEPASSVLREAGHAVILTTPGEAEADVAAALGAPPPAKVEPLAPLPPEPEPEQEEPPALDPLETMVEILMEVARADEVVKPEELQVLNKYFTELGYRGEQLERIQNQMDNAGHDPEKARAGMAQLKPDARELLFRTAFHVAISDNDFDAREREVLLRLAAELDQAELYSSLVEQYECAGSDPSEASLAVLGVDHSATPERVQAAYTELNSRLVSQLEDSDLAPMAQSRLLQVETAYQALTGQATAEQDRRTEPLFRKKLSEMSLRHASLSQLADQGLLIVGDVLDQARRDFIGVNLTRECLTELANALYRTIPPGHALYPDVLLFDRIYQEQASQPGLGMASELEQQVIEILGFLLWEELCECEVADDCPHVSPGKVARLQQLDHLDEFQCAVDEALRGRASVLLTHLVERLEMDLQVLRGLLHCCNQALQEVRFDFDGRACRHAEGILEFERADEQPEHFFQLAPHILGRASWEAVCSAGAEVELTRQQVEQLAATQDLTAWSQQLIDLLTRDPGFHALDEVAVELQATEPELRGLIYCLNRVLDGLIVILNARVLALQSVVSEVHEALKEDQPPPVSLQEVQLHLKSSGCEQLDMDALRDMLEYAETELATVNQQEIVVAYRDPATLEDRLYALLWSHGPLDESALLQRYAESFPRTPAEQLTECLHEQSETFVQIRDQRWCLVGSEPEESAEQTFEDWLETTLGAHWGALARCERTSACPEIPDELVKELAEHEAIEAISEDLHRHLRATRSPYLGQDELAQAVETRPEHLRVALHCLYRADLGEALLVGGLVGLEDNWRGLHAQFAAAHPAPCLWDEAVRSLQIWNQNLGAEALEDLLYHFGGFTEVVRGEEILISFEELNPTTLDGLTAIVRALLWKLGPLDERDLHQELRRTFVNHDFKLTELRRALEREPDFELVGDSWKLEGTEADEEPTPPRNASQERALLAEQVQKVLLEHGPLDYLSLWRKLRQVSPDCPEPEEHLTAVLEGDQRFYKHELNWYLRSDERDLPSEQVTTELYEFLKKADKPISANLAWQQLRARLGLEQPGAVLQAAGQDERIVIYPYGSENHLGLVEWERGFHRAVVVTWGQTRQQAMDCLQGRTPSTGPVLPDDLRVWSAIHEELSGRVGDHVLKGLLRSKLERLKDAPPPAKVAEEPHRPIEVKAPVKVTTPEPPEPEPTDVAPVADRIANFLKLAGKPMPALKLCSSLRWGFEEESRQRLHDEVDRDPRLVRYPYGLANYVGLASWDVKVQREVAEVTWPLTRDQVASKLAGRRPKSGNPLPDQPEVWEAIRHVAQRRGDSTTLAAAEQILQALQAPPPTEHLPATSSEGIWAEVEAKATSTAIERLAERIQTAPSPCSLAELGLTQADVEWLRNWAQHLPGEIAGQWVGSLVKHGPCTQQEGIGLLLMALACEVGRRESTEGSIWPCVEACFSRSTARELFVQHQPHSATKQAIEAAARKFNLRHAFGQAGGQSWLLTVYFQFGFTRHGIRRLPSWLDMPETVTEAIALLLSRDGGSRDFESAWRALGNYRRGGSDSDLVSSLRNNPFILPEWLDEIKVKARQPLEPTGRTLSLSGDQAAYFRWDGVADPYFELLLASSLPLGELDDSGIDVLVKGETRASLLRQSDGSYRCEPETIQAPCSEPFLTLVLECHSKDQTLTHSIQLWSADAELSAYDLADGRLVPAERLDSLSTNREYALILPADATLNPPARTVLNDAFEGRSLHYLARGWSGDTCAVAGETVLWSVHPPAATSTLPSCQLVRLRKDPVLLGQEVELHLVGLPSEATLVSARWGPRRLPVELQGNAHVIRLVPDADFASGTASVQLTVFYQGRQHRFQKSCPIPLCGVLRLVDGDWQVCNQVDRLDRRSARETPFRFLLSNEGLPAHTRWALVEGDVFHSRPRSYPAPLTDPDLAGYGGTLRVQPGPYNSLGRQLVLAREVVWTGLAQSFAALKNQYRLQLKRPARGDDFSLVWWSPGSPARRSYPDIQEDGLVWTGLIPPGISPDDFVVGIDFEGACVGAWWESLSVPRSGGLKTASYLRWFHVPLMARHAIEPVRAAAHSAPVPFLKAWLLERRIELDDKGDLIFPATGPEWLSVVRRVFQDWSPSNATEAKALLEALAPAQHMAVKLLLSVDPILTVRVVRSLQLSNTAMEVLRDSMCGVRGGNERDYRARLEQLAVEAGGETDTDPGFIRNLVRQVVGEFRSQGSLSWQNRLNLALACHIDPFRRYLAAQLMDSSRS